MFGRFSNRLYRELVGELGNWGIGEFLSDSRIASTGNWLGNWGVFGRFSNRLYRELVGELGNWGIGEFLGDSRIASTGGWREGFGVRALEMTGERPYQGTMDKIYPLSVVIFS
jgi:hypothetical protein